MGFRKVPDDGDLPQISDRFAPAVVNASHFFGAAHLSEQHHPESVFFNQTQFFRPHNVLQLGTSGLVEALRRSESSRITLLLSRTIKTANLTAVSPNYVFIQKGLTIKKGN